MFLYQELTTPELTGDKKPVVSALRTIISLTLMALIALLVFFLADWAQLRGAIREFGGHPWLLAALLIGYTGAFCLRAVAWRSLILNRVSVYRLFVSVQAGLLVNHLAPVKLGEFVRPLLATRYGVPIAEAATTTAIARVLDFAALLIIAVGVGAWLSGGDEFWLRGLALSAAVTFGCVGGFC